MATITEDYVSFETAKLLKERGFPQKQENSGYYATEMVYCVKESKDGSHHFCHQYPACYDKNEDYVCAPTLQMTYKWLIQEHRLYVNVAPSIEGYYWVEKWHSYIEDLNKRYKRYPYGKFIGTFNSPEEACEAAIKCCLENLI